METPSLEPKRPSSWWLLLAAICGVLAVGFAVGGLAVQRNASEPIGEGELFVEDAMTAADLIEAHEDPLLGVRKARNALEIEAVSIVDGSGRISASTSPNLVGLSLDNSFLAFSVSEGRFAALATPVGSPIFLDGVRTWDPPDVLYQVASPMAERRSALLHYDISELLSRRVRPAGIQSETIELLTLTAIFAVIGTSLAIGHMRASRRYQALAKESELLRKHADELALANVELDHARRRAERALDLAEEKIRIRSEFVLMINHELRTPLTSVITGAKLLRDHDIGIEERRQLLDAVVEDGTRLQEMIDQILAVARIENRGLSYDLGETSMTELRGCLSQAKADLAEEDPGMTGVRVLTDANAVGLVVASLADNARTHGAASVTITYGLERSVQPQVEVGEEPDPALYVTVIDDGPGIDSSFLPRVFEKFEKSSYSSGTGLGLYMARTIVEALDGSIAVETSPEGTSFEIALPIARVREPTLRR